MQKILNFIFIFNFLVLEKSNSAERDIPFNIKLYPCFNFKKNENNEIERFNNQNEKDKKRGISQYNKSNNNNNNSRKREIFDNKNDGIKNNEIPIKSTRKGSDQVKKNDLKENVPFLDLLQKDKNLNNNLTIRSSSPLKNNKGPVKPK